MKDDAGGLMFSNLIKGSFKRGLDTDVARIPFDIHRTAHRDIFL